MRRRLLPAGLPGLAFLVLIGCGGEDKPVPVKGTVTLDGKPVGGAAVLFLSDDGNRRASGETAENGSYELTTKVTGDGAFPGNYKVMITWEPPPEGYSRQQGGDNPDIKRALSEAQEKRRRAAKVVIPPLYGDTAKTPLKQTVPAPGGKADFALDSKAK